MNPLHQWRHKKPVEVHKRKVYDLCTKPIKQDNGTWIGIYAIPIQDRNKKIPNLVGCLFRYKSEFYTATSQAVLCNTEIIRELQYKHGDKYVYLVMCLEIEEDDYYCLVQSMKN